VESFASLGRFSLTAFEESCGEQDMICCGGDTQTRSASIHSGKASIAFKRIVLIELCDPRTLLR
jgi:hypothetical protein